MIVANPDLVRNICFSDGCSFLLLRHVNKPNLRYWSDKNYRIIRNEDTQKPQKIMFEQEY